MPAGIVTHRRTILGPAAGPSGPVPLDSDNFNRADSTSTPGSTAGARAWTAYQGTWGISSNAAYTSAANAVREGAVMATDFGAADVNITLDFSGWGVSKGGGIVFRLVDNNNYWMCQLYQVGANVQWYLLRFVSGTETVVSGPNNIGAVSTGTGQVACLGSSIKLYFNGSPLSGALFTDSTLSTATGAGVACYNSTAMRFDNFAISTITVLP